MHVVDAWEILPADVDFGTLNHLKYALVYDKVTSKSFFNVNDDIIFVKRLLILNALIIFIHKQVVVKHY